MLPDHVKDPALTPNGGIVPPSAEAAAAARERLGQLTKPVGSLGVLEDVAIWAAAVQDRCPPHPFEQVRAIVVAGDHGVATTVGTSAYPADVTAQMVANFVAGGAAINVLARHLGARIVVVDASVDSDYRDLAVPAEVWRRRIRRGSGSIDVTDALTQAECAAALALGRALADEHSDADLVIVGDMGIGNTTPAAVLIAALTGADPAPVTGRGTGIDDATWMRKVSAVRDTLWRVRDDCDDAIRLLGRAGGADLAVMCGLLLGCAESQIPVVLDGVVVSAAALVAERLQPGSRAWWVAGHLSVEPAHAVALRSLDLQPIVQLGMCLGEGSGALTAVPVIQSAIVLLAEMTTFESAGIRAVPHESDDGPTSSDSADSAGTSDPGSA